MELTWIAVVAVGYLLGGIPVGLIVGKATKGVDIRQYGSGKVGATNTLRTLGWGPSAVVLLLDMAKAVASVLAQIAEALNGDHAGGVQPHTHRQAAQIVHCLLGPGHSRLISFATQMSAQHSIGWGEE